MELYKYFIIYFFSLTCFQPTISLELEQTDVDLTECGNSKNCWRIPTQCASVDLCTYVLTWRRVEDHVVFEISHRRQDPRHTWIALGFSLDDRMGDDSTVNCVFDTRVTFSVRSAWNRASPLRNTPFGDDNLGFVDQSMNLKASDETVYCRFLRKMRVSGNLSEFVYPLDRNLYLLLATGPLNVNERNMGLISKHEESPSVSPRLINVSLSTGFVDIGSPTIVVPPLVKAHGILMIIAWILLASVGIMMPRYLKLLKLQIFQKDAWFRIHQVVMLSALVLTLSAFVIIFVYRRGYSQFTQSVYAAHPVIGIIVTTFALINPIMALFRPEPSSSRRPVFNWLHFLVGSSAHILALIAIFLGLNMQIFGNSKSATFPIMITFTIIFILLEFFLKLTSLSSSKLHSFIRNQETKLFVLIEGRSVFLTKALTTTYIAVTFVVTITLVVILIKN